MKHVALKAVERGRAAFDLHTENCAFPGSQEDFQLDIPITPDDVAAMVVSFLCDDKTGLTGSALSLEGGVPCLRTLSDGLAASVLESASPDKMAGAELFLASEQSRRITGMQLFLTGGMAPL